MYGKTEPVGILVGPAVQDAQVKRSKYREVSALRGKINVSFLSPNEKVTRPDRSRASSYRR